MILYNFRAGAASGIPLQGEFLQCALPQGRFSTKINKYRLRVESVAERTGAGSEGKMRRLFVLLSMLVLTSTAAMADGLNLNWREARVVKLAKPAASIIVGDPTVADVTLDTPDTVIIFGKTPGETNLLVLSANQELLLDWPVMVSPTNQQHVTVLNAAGAEAPVEVLYACGTERCTRVLSPTDVQFSSSASSSTSSDTDASKSASSTERTNSAAADGNQNVNPGGSDNTQ
jgi:Flp pilus assembly secretin CpaC